MKRTLYMTNLMASTYPMVAIEAVQRGFDGAWERLIAQRIEKDYLQDHSEAREIVDSIYSGEDFNLKEAYLKAAYLITSSEIEPANDDLQNVKLGQEL